VLPWFSKIIADLGRLAVALPDAKKAPRNRLLGYLYRELCAPRQRVYAVCLHDLEPVDNRMNSVDNLLSKKPSMPVALAKQTVLG
jgi:hypothetical protein